MGFNSGFKGLIIMCGKDTENRMLEKKKTLPAVYAEQSEAK